MKRQIILASQSPRRKQLLKQIGLTDFIIQESAYEEDMTLDKTPEELAEFLSLEKAKEVANHYDDAVIIAGDTMIFFKDKVIGKPKNKEEAIKMLTKFSGQKVGCVSGLAIIDTKNNRKIVNHDIGWVNFRKLDKKEIIEYVNSEENVLGFAGGFGLLNKGAILIDSTEGDFFSIIGLPLTKLYLGLKDLGVDILKI